MKSGTARVTGTEVAAVSSTGTPIKWRMAEALAELGPSGLEKAFIKGGILFVELAAGDLEEFGKVDFLGALGITSFFSILLLRRDLRQLAGTEVD
jgi:hypothetical protein